MPSAAGTRTSGGGGQQGRKDGDPHLKQLDLRKKERECYSKLLSVIDTFLDLAVTAIEDVVNPHNQLDLLTIFRMMTKDNMVKNSLPKYAAGTGFAKTLNALATLSVAAANTCTAEMTRATDHLSARNTQHSILQRPIVRNYRPCDRNPGQEPAHRRHRIGACSVPTRRKQGTETQTYQSNA